MPLYWRNEPAGTLGEAMVRLLNGEPLTIRDVAFIRAYCRQWITAAVWDQVSEGAKKAALAELRAGVSELVTAGAIHQWMARTVQWGLSPL